MGNFIILKCENCGAQLEFSEKRDVYYCEHCGYKHLYENIFSGAVDESYAACPLCRRNDKAQKVTTLDKKYPSPRKPHTVTSSFLPPKKENVLIRILGYILVCLSFISLIIIWRNWLHQIYAVPLVFCTYFPLLGIGTSLIRSQKNYITENKQAYKQWLHDKDRYERIFPVYDAIMDLWNDLYYCHRDGIVYVKDRNDYTSIENMYEYIENIALGN